MTMASCGVPAADQCCCLTYKDVPAGPWRYALWSSWSGNSGTCSTAAAEAEPSMGVGCSWSHEDCAGCRRLFGLVEVAKTLPASRTGNLKNYLQKSCSSTLLYWYLCYQHSGQHVYPLPALNHISLPSYLSLDVKSPCHWWGDTQSLVRSLFPHFALRSWFWIPALSLHSEGIDFNLFKTVLILILLSMAWGERQFSSAFSLIYRIK